MLEVTEGGKFPVLGLFDKRSEVKWLEHHFLAYWRAQELPTDESKRVTATIIEVGNLMEQNLRVFKEKDKHGRETGVREVFTSVSVMELIARLTSDPEMKRKAEWVLEQQIKTNHGTNQKVFALNSSAPNFTTSTDGGPTTAEDAGLRMLMEAIPEVWESLKHCDAEHLPEDKVLVFLGSTSNPGSKTTEKHNKKMEQDAFSAMGELNAKLIAENYPNLDQLVVVGGVSFGAVLALRMIRFLPKRIQKNASVWAANVDPMYGEAAPRDSNWVKMTLGIATNFPDLYYRFPHYASKGLWVLFKGTIEDEYRQMLDNQNIDYHDSPKQAELKKQGLRYVLKSVAEGPDRFGCRLFPEELELLEILYLQGAFDLTNQSPKEAAQALLFWARSNLNVLAGKPDNREFYLGYQKLGESRNGKIRKVMIAAGHALDLCDVRLLAEQTRCLEFNPDKADLPDWWKN